VSDLEAAARWFCESADHTPPDSPAMARRQAALGHALRDIYARTGEFGLLDDAIGRYRQALAIAGAQAPARATYLDNLGMALLDRYERTGGIDDLDESVRLLRMAREATPEDGEALAGVLNNLGTALWNRYVHRPPGGDLDEALEAFRHAVEHTAPGAPDAAIYLDNLANALGDRYQATGDVEDLDRAVSTYEQALTGLPDGAPERLRIRTNLAACLLTRYRGARARGDADTRDLCLAVEILQEAVARTPPGAPALVSRLNSLGVGLKYRFECHHDVADLDRGRATLGAAGGPQGAHDVRWSLAAALTLAGWAGERGDWDEAADAYRTAMATAEDYLRIQLVRDSTEAALRGVGGLYADAAHAFGRIGQSAQAAAAVERGRAVLLSEALDRERALADLLASADREDVAALAERFRRATSRVRALTGLARPRGEFLSGSSG
jgi:tetratricopeptide (TPR) repeat protein